MHCPRYRACVRWYPSLALTFRNAPSIILSNFYISILLFSTCLTTSLSALSLLLDYNSEAFAFQKQLESSLLGTNNHCLVVCALHDWQLMNVLSK
jgi:hypothetical protein